MECRNWQKNLNVWQIPTVGHSAKSLTNSQGHWKQEKSEKVLNQEKPKETWLLNLMWHHWWNPRTEEGNYNTVKRKRNKPWIGRKYLQNISDIDFLSKIIQVTIKIQQQQARTELKNLAGIY